MTELLTSQQLADRWQVGKAHIDQRRAKGMPPKAVDISLKGSKRKTIRYRLEDIEKYERENILSPHKTKR